MEKGRPDPFHSAREGKDAILEQAVISRILDPLSMPIGSSPRTPDRGHDRFQAA